MDTGHRPDRALEGTRTHKGVNYLPEIDGLRAVAVLAVMLYHADRTWLPGGYAGVDVFFVISGYLITRVILADIERERFSLWRFWDRRVRRILPPLLAVLAASLAAGYALFSPVELAGLGSSAFASLFSLANVYFWHSAGSYFGLAAPLQPLLHLWSLGVEEQFYIAYPILLLLASRYWPQGLARLLALGIAGSFGLAWYTSGHHPSAGFFLPFSRAWELASGCLLAVTLADRPRPSRGLAEGGSAIALAVLAASLFLFDDLTPWPGPATALVVAASAALIALSPSAPVVGRLLANRPMVAIGLVSYAAYLWHHPLLAFSRVANPDVLAPLGAVALLALSLGLGALSYRFVEGPARDRSRLPARMFWPAIVLASLLIGGAAFQAWRSGGAPGRLPPDLLRVSAMTETYPEAMNPCFYPPGTSKTFEQSCTLGLAGPVRMAVIGDSHAMALAPGFKPALDQTRTRARLLIAAGCPPVSDQRVMSALQPHCPAFTEHVLSWLVQHSEVSVVAIAARWPFSFHHSFYDNGEGGVEMGPDDGLEPDEARNRLFETSLRETVDRLLAANKTVVLIYPVPEPGWDVPKYLVHRYLQGRGGGMPTIDAARWRARAAGAVAMLDRMGDDPRIIRVRPAAMTCGTPRAGRCALGHGDMPFYFDDDHPNREGARIMIADALQRRGGVQALERALRQGVD